MINLNKVPKNVTIIDGFPGYGLVATITTEFLVEHLKAELIGKHWFEDDTPSIAIHEGKIIYPINFYYDSQHNIIIVHSIYNSPGSEWKSAELIRELSQITEAKEIISLEGIGGKEFTEEEPQVYFYTNNQNIEELKSYNIKELKEGILIGVTSALFLKLKVPITGLFVETHSQLPDSKAASKLIEILNYEKVLKL